MTATTEGRSSRNRFIDRILFVLLGALVVLAFVMEGGSPLDGLVGKEAPAFKLPTRSGKTVGPADFGGQTVIIDFWAAWCEPCFRQMPKLEEVRDIVGSDVVILSVNLDDPSNDRAHKIDRFIESANVDFDTLIDNGSAAQLYGVSTLPSLVVVGPDGVVRWTGTGVHDVKTLVKKVEAARAETGGNDG